MKRYQCGHRKRCEERLELLRPYVQGRLLDVGCAEGYFATSLVQDATSVVAIERDFGKVEDFDKVVDGCRDVKFIETDVQEWLRRNEMFDTTLYMSVHHHIILAKGWDRARNILSRLLHLTRGFMIFDMGQKNEKFVRNKMPPWWHELPDDPPDDLIWNELTKAGGTLITKIGGSPVHQVQRGLWLVSR